jgi:hypothetical protein
MSAMRLLTTVSVCLGYALPTFAASIPAVSSTTSAVMVTLIHTAGAPTGVLVTSTIEQRPDLIQPNMAPIVSNTSPPKPHSAPPGTCGQAVQVTMLGSVWIQASACRRFTEKGDIPAHVVEFTSEGYTNCKSCAFWK